MLFAKMILKKEIKLKIKYKYFIPFVLKLVIKRTKITYKLNILILEYIFKNLCLIFSFLLIKLLNNLYSILLFGENNF